MRAQKTARSSGLGSRIGLLGVLAFSLIGLGTSCSTDRIADDEDGPGGKGRPCEHDADCSTGRRCIDLVWWMETAALRGVHTTVLVQGDTLGGGLESVLPFHKVVFERSAQAGFPEVLFNLFPGMGAWQFTIRKAGFAVANDMILSGRLYTAEQLLRRSLVDAVVDDGAGEEAMLEIVRGVDPKLRGTLAALRAQRMAAPITYESLVEAVDLWAETALTLTTRDLRLMERLARAQVRKAGGAEEGAVEEIKRIELDTAWGELRSGNTVFDEERGTGLTAWGAL